MENMCWGGADVCVMGEEDTVLTDWCATVTSERISGSNGRHLLSDSIKHVSSGKPLIRSLHGGINGEDVLFGLSNASLERFMCTVCTAKLAGVSFYSIFYLHSYYEISNYL